MEGNEVKYSTYSWEQEKAMKGTWHKKFVIFPRCVGARKSDGKLEFRFLETLYRRGKYVSGYADSGWEYEYITVDEYERKYGA